MPALPLPVTDDVCTCTLMHVRPPVMSSFLSLVPLFCTRTFFVSNWLKMSTNCVVTSGRHIFSYCEAGRRGIPRVSQAERVYLKSKMFVAVIVCSNCEMQNSYSSHLSRVLILFLLFQVFFFPFVLIHERNQFHMVTRVSTTLDFPATWPSPQF